MKQDTWQKQKQQILKELDERMDFLLIGSVVTYHHKCCKTCRCNKGKGHLGHYLSANINGKTKNLYLNKEVVDAQRPRDLYRTVEGFGRFDREGDAELYYLFTGAVCI